MFKFVISAVVGVVVIVGGWLHFNNALPVPAPVKQNIFVATTSPQSISPSSVPSVTKSITAPQKEQVVNILAKYYSTFSTNSIPLGDGKVSSLPKVGYVYSCQTSFRGGGASHSGDWIHGSTWDMSQKISVLGKVYWPNASFSSVINGITRTITGNGLPVSEPTGTFPISVSDPAFQIDRNPNAIRAQNISYSLPSNPQFASSPSCLPMGAIGIALDGVTIYNALDDGGRDAVAHEVQDLCDGHPQMAGQYHYHGPSPCMPGADKPETLVGYALDGYGIYSKYDSKGHEYTDADLDECHGLTSEVIWNGKLTNIYHYVLTDEYPYTLGCFRGTPLRHGTM